MVILSRNKPQSQDILSDSQVDLLNNNNAIDDSFGADHYSASDLTSNNGKHRIITTPTQTAHPATTTDVRFYAAQDHASIGALQYTRGLNDAVQTPVTNLQSSATTKTLGATSTSTILDFSGIPFSYGVVYSCGTIGAGAARALYMFFWNGTTGTVNGIVTTTGILIEFSGSILRLRTLAQAYEDYAWTLEFKRILTSVPP